MRVDTYLTFNGNCKEALESYAKTLGGSIEAMMIFADTPAANHVPPEWSDKVLHASLLVAGQRIMASDAPPGTSDKPQGFNVSVQVETTEEAERVFSELNQGGKTTMPMAETFWAGRFGMLVDRFGTPWLVNCPIEVPGCK